MKISWKIKIFEELNTIELYNILRLRSEVFVVEQNCPYQDMDGKDSKSFHLVGLDDNNEIVAYARILPAGISYKEVSIGRVVISNTMRGKGMGKELMKESINFIGKQFGKVPIRISAQCYLKNFYKSLGFEIASEEYLEDNIPHVEMVLKKV
ncbi:MAG: GNAT family N-acetyltransferase [Bacteroidota bacterium]